MKRVLLLCAATFALTGAPASASTTPKPPERWEGATPLAFARPTDRCEGQRQGDWVRLLCAKRWFVTGFRLLGGSAEGVTLEAAGKGGGAYAIFPVHPGDRRLFVIDQLGDMSSYTVDMETFAVISETWLPGEAEPTITVD